MKDNQESLIYRFFEKEKQSNELMDIDFPENENLLAEITKCFPNQERNVISQIHESIKSRFIQLLQQWVKSHFIDQIKSGTSNYSLKAGEFIQEFHITPKLLNSVITPMIKKNQYKIRLSRDYSTQTTSEYLELNQHYRDLDETKSELSTLIANLDTREGQFSIDDSRISETNKLEITFLDKKFDISPGVLAQMTMWELQVSQDINFSRMMHLVVCLLKSGMFDPTLTGNTDRDYPGRLYYLYLHYNPDWRDKISLKAVLPPNEQQVLFLLGEFLSDHVYTDDVAFNPFNIAYIYLSTHLELPHDLNNDRVYGIGRIQLENSHIISLDLTGFGLPTVARSPLLITNAYPEELDQEMTKVRRIDTLPECIGDLIYLKSLKLGRNALTSLPDSLENLVNLTFLELNGNQLTHLPFSIGKLRLLEWLDVSDNLLTDIPITLTHLTELKELVILNNRIRHLDSDILYFLHSFEDDDDRYLSWDSELIDLETSDLRSMNVKHLLYFLNIVQQAYPGSEVWLGFRSVLDFMLSLNFYLLKKRQPPLFDYTLTREDDRIVCPGYDSDIEWLDEKSYLRWQCGISISGAYNRIFPSEKGNEAVNKLNLQLDHVDGLIRKLINEKLEVCDIDSTNINNLIQDNITLGELAKLILKGK